ncbi:nucleic acid/nucleotide deaminase of polymorphic system toxin [Streptomyces sp. SLBN-118]|uniref:SUKH-4 family immunity protein n=1 Tax=Streptomyces sp. SLBN-118 TaxID=2768454 RepID=UPI001150A901|nr:SUKH-4 family immunity protein [Streptomyces sp. SLBN-118]TQK45053.1 nucleic acid/nucleotide deaminase of polymorphic system toxin [Streptomyces sp. SLBN-118]
MVTFAQAQERAEEWVNGDVPAYQHREVRVREFELGFVVWAEDREGGARSDGGEQRLVIARDSGEATLWPGLPVGEVIRRYEEEYGVQEAAAAAPEPPQRIDLNQTSFLLSPPEWLQEAADRIGIPDRRSPESAAASGASPAGAGSGSGSGTDSSPSSRADWSAPAAASAAAGPNASQAGGSSSSASGSAWPAAGSSAGSAGGGSGADASQGGAGWPGARGGDYEPTASEPAPPPGATPWTDTSAAGPDDASVPLPATVFAPPISGSDDDDTPPPATGADAPTALMSGGSQLPRTAVAPALDRPGTGAPAGPAGPAGPVSPGAADIADAATSKAVLPPRAARGASRGSGSTTPPPPGAPGTPGARPGATPPPSGPGAPGAPAGGYLPTQLVPQLGPEGPQPPGSPAPPGSTPPPGGVHHAATMLADPSRMGPGAPQPPGAPRPPGPPGAPGAPGAPQPPGPPGAPTPPGPPGGGVHHAATMLAGPAQAGPGVPQPPGPPGAPPGPPPGAVPPAPQPPHGVQPPAYGYPQQPTGMPTVGPGYQAVLRYRAPDGSEAQLIRRSAPGTPHPEWQILHELRAMNVPPQQVLELHTELESCELPGAYCARMIRESWPQARITSIAPYGKDHASRQQGMQQLLAHQGELHQVADGPARPAPVRAPLPQMPPAPPIPPEGIAQELLAAFGPQGICRFDQRGVSRQGVPEIVAATLVWAGLPGDFNPFFWAQPAQPVVPTLAELAAQRQVQPAADAGSYLVVGSDFGRAICVQYGTAHIVAVPVEAGPGGQPVAPQFVNSGLPEFVRCLALLGRMWRLRFNLNPEQAGRWTVDFQAQLAALDPAALASPESWWSVLLEQMWDGLL